MGIRSSMKSVDDGFHSAMVKSLFATLECELLAQVLLIEQHAALPADGKKRRPSKPGKQVSVGVA